MVQVQLLTGMRTGEVCVMRGIDIDMTGKVWLYRPGSDQGPQGEHKTAHHGYQRVIAIGPKAQEVIRPFLKLDTRAYLFSPQEAIVEVRAERRRRRKTKVQPSQQDRGKRRPKKAPGKRYTTSSYAHAIKSGCRKADAAAHAKDPSIPNEHVLVPHWHPHQLRHTRATELWREYGLDTARAVLGHTSPAVTEVYAELGTAGAHPIAYGANDDPPLPAPTKRASRASGVSRRANPILPHLAATVAECSSILTFAPVMTWRAHRAFCHLPTTCMSPATRVHS